MSSLRLGRLHVIIETILERTTQFAEAVALQDDVTQVVIQRTNGPAS